MIPVFLAVHRQRCGVRIILVIIPYKCISARHTPLEVRRSVEITNFTENLEVTVNKLRPAIRQSNLDAVQHAGGEVCAHFISSGKLPILKLTSLPRFSGASQRAIAMMRVASGYTCRGNSRWWVLQRRR
jgi:hypothetical protein